MGCGFFVPRWCRGTMNELLAKSLKEGQQPKTLLQHSVDVMNVAEWLFGTSETPTRLGQQWLRFFNVPADAFAVFHINLLASAAFHDWGKANDGFQKAVRNQGEQVIRHEHLSALLLGLDPVTQWLKTRNDIDADIVLSAVLTHHLKAAADLAKRHAFAAPLGSLTQLQVYNDHPDFQQLLREVAQRLGLSEELPVFPRPSFWAFKDDHGVLPPFCTAVEVRRDNIKDQRLRRLEVALRKDTDEARLRKRLLWAVRVGLIVADAVGSGLPRVGKDMRPWIAAVFNDSLLCTEEFVKREIITRRVADLDRKLNPHGKSFKWDEFQLNCDKLSARALLLAPCGSGKTLAAWRWIAAQLKERPMARVLFLYPTRA